MTQSVSPPLRVGVVAPCSAVGQVELALGLEVLRGAGFEVTVHPQCASIYYTFAGTDQQRAAAFFDYARDPAIDVLWSARGGYGAVRLLPLLAKMTKEFGAPPKKLLVGYSDVTVLHEFVRREWGWDTLHATMPAGDLRSLAPQQWDAIVSLVNGRKTKLQWHPPTLHWLTPPPAAPIRAALIGGNLSLWCSLAGTRYEPRGRRRIIFLEDVSEPPYRIDRMFQQIVQAGMIDGAAAIVLGDFTDCVDEKSTVLKQPLDEAGLEKVRADRSAGERVPIRPAIDLPAALNETFGTIGREMNIPVAVGLPVGHGPNYWPLPLGARYTLRPDGQLELWRWDWAGPQRGAE